LLDPPGMLNGNRSPQRKLPGAWRYLRADPRRQQAATVRVRSLARVNGSLPPHESAKLAGLRYVSDARLAGIRRIGRCARVRYVDASGRTISDRTELQRIRALAIPPAWTDVWICPDARGHLQATGRDARGRKQYRYHLRWRVVRDEVKYGRLIAFAQALPRIRERTEADLRHNQLSRRKVLAAVVQLLEKTLIRVGNEEYARHNESVGLTTMRDQHATVNGSTVRFEFRGKSGIEHAIDLRDARLARIVKACRELPGYELFQYIDDHGERQVIDSADVNAYLRETTGEDFTSKDFRTWTGTVLAAKALADVAACKSNADARRNIARAVESVAKRLGNTKTVCRKCYIHPAILHAYVDGATIETLKTRARRLATSAGTLTVEERAVVRLIERGLKARRHPSLSQRAT
jgi:DNA topoisomerase-1